MNPQKPSKAFFAVKRKSDDGKCAPRLVAIVESYDDGIDLAERRNHYADGDPYYVATHSAS